MHLSQIQVNCECPSKGTGIFVSEHVSNNSLVIADRDQVGGSCVGQETKLRAKFVLEVYGFGLLSEAVENGLAVSARMIPAETGSCSDSYTSTLIFPSIRTRTSECACDTKVKPPT